MTPALVPCLRWASVRKLSRLESRRRRAPPGGGAGGGGRGGLGHARSRGGGPAQLRRGRPGQGCPPAGGRGLRGGGGARALGRQRGQRGGGPSHCRGAGLAAGSSLGPPRRRARRVLEGQSRVVRVGCDRGGRRDAGGEQPALHPPGPGLGSDAAAWGWPVVPAGPGGCPGGGLPRPGAGGSGAKLDPPRRRGA